MHACRWANGRGTESAVVEAEFGDLRGAAAVASIRALESVVNVPQHCLINDGTALKSDIVRTPPYANRQG